MKVWIAKPLNYFKCVYCNRFVFRHYFTIRTSENKFRRVHSECLKHFLFDSVKGFYLKESQYEDNY